MGTPTTTVGLWIDCGTRYEKLSEMGTGKCLINSDIWPKQSKITKIMIGNKTDLFI